MIRLVYGMPSTSGIMRACHASHESGIAVTTGSKKTNAATTAAPYVASTSRGRATRASTHAARIASHSTSEQSHEARHAASVASEVAAGVQEIAMTARTLREQTERLDMLIGTFRVDVLPSFGERRALAA